MSPRKRENKRQFRCLTEDLLRGFVTRFIPLLIVGHGPASANEPARVLGPNPAAATCASPTPVAMTLSGGVSLGAYQAGTLYFSSLVLKNNPAHFQTHLITGSSAGALNGFLTLLSMCQEPARPELPSDSAFFKTWTNFRAEDLLPTDARAESLFTRHVFENLASDLQTRWSRGLSKSCDIVLGLSITRLHPRTDASAIGFSRQAEKLSLRIRGRGAGRPPQITNFVNPALFPRPILLDLKSSGEAKDARPVDSKTDALIDAHNFESLKSALFASSAFPIAFEPQTLRTCLPQSNERWAHAGLPFQCSADEVETAKFLDGGVIDNKPLALAEKTLRTGLVADTCGRARWREIPSHVSTADSVRGSDVLYLYSDLSSKTYAPTEKRGDDLVSGIVPMLIGEVFNGNRNQDSASLLEQSPALENQIAAFQNSVPRMGDSLYGFFGFLERDFRIFDFYLGLWETQNFFEQNLRSRLRRGGVSFAQNIVLPDFEKSSIDATRLACLDAALAPIADAARTEKACAETGDSNFSRLARLARARLDAHRTDFAFMMEWLANERYTFQDLGLRPGDAWRAPAKIKTAALDSIRKLASSHPPVDSFVIRTLGPVALNMIEPLPIENDVSIGVGPQSLLTFSTLISAGVSLNKRWNLGVGIENIDAWLGRDGGRAIATPFTGLELEPLSLANRFLQTRFALGAGYKFGTEPRDAHCEPDREAPSHCRGVVVRIGASLTILERLRLQTDLETMPFQKERAVPWQIRPSIGLQFYF